MEKRETKRTTYGAKRKSLVQITYPAPYSQSWNPDVLPVLMKNSVGRSSRKLPKRPSSKSQCSEHATESSARPLRMDAEGFSTGRPSKRPVQSSRAWSQQFPDRPDPTAPHLKYGVFRNRRGSAPRPLMPTIDRLPKKIPQPDKQFKPKQNPSNPHVIRVPQVLISKNKSFPSSKKSEMKKSNTKFPPVVVIRNKDRNDSRRLSRSKMMHMDIKPIRFLSPSFCPSPNFRGLPRKHSPSKAYRLDSAVRL